MVPDRFMALENVCFEWCKAGIPHLDGSNRCPRIMAGAAKCDWDHVVPANTPQQLIGEFIVVSTPEPAASDAPHGRPTSLAEARWGRVTGGGHVC